MRSIEIRDAEGRVVHREQETAPVVVPAWVEKLGMVIAVLFITFVLPGVLL